MPKRNRPEFYWIAKRQLYRKRFKGPDGLWHDAYGRTRERCRENASAMLQELKSAPPPAAETGLLVHQYAATWYALNSPDVKESTRERWRTNINSHICPAIGSTEVAAVKEDDIRRMMASCSGLAKSTRQKIFQITRRIFASAVNNELAKKNPCDNIKVSGPPPVKREALTDLQRTQLLQAVAGTRAETFVLLCLDTGLRREEALGLDWDSVYLDEAVPYLQVRRAVNFGKNGVPELVNYGKSEAAFRRIPLPPELSAMLRSKRGRKTTGPVIHDAHGKICSKQSFRKLWDAVRAREEHEATVWENGVKTRRVLHVGERIPKHNVTIALDFHPTPHMLRHTYITRLILSGANIKTVQYLAGHATVQITLDIYTHLTENRPEDTQAAVLAAFGGT